MKKWKLTADCPAGNPPVFHHAGAAEIWGKAEKFLHCAIPHLEMPVYPPLIRVGIHTLVWGVHQVDAFYGRTRISPTTVYDETLARVYLLDRAEIESGRAPIPLSLHEPTFYGIVGSVRTELNEFSSILGLELSVEEPWPFTGAVQLWRTRLGDLRDEPSFPITLKGRLKAGGDDVEQVLLNEFAFEGIRDYVPAMLMLERIRAVHVANVRKSGMEQALARCNGSLAELSEIALR